MVHRKSLSKGFQMGPFERTSNCPRDGEPSDVAAMKRDLYRSLLDSFEQEFTQRDALGLIFMDGDGSDSTYRDAHRRLPRQSRRIVEDPIPQDSKASQLMQMADLVAWTANAHLDPPPKLVEAESWWETYLSARALDRLPEIIVG
ncbi:MAG: DUF3800 domain-containing protein [Propionibacteriaceae bacterium]